MERFEHWKRSKFPRAAMRRLMTEMLGSSTERGSIVLVRLRLPPLHSLVRSQLSSPPLSCLSRSPDPSQAAVSKMFVGELVENARARMTAAGETGPIQPSHLRHALRQAQRSGTVPRSTRQSSRLFWRPDCGS
jgi:transcription initiation factor TFIID subunit 11